MNRLKSSYHFSGGYAPYKGANGKYGFIDSKGKEVIKAKYDIVGFFSEGYAAVGEIVNEITVQLLFIDINERKLNFGNYFFISLYDNNNKGGLPYFKNGLFKAHKKNEIAPRYFNKKGATPAELSNFEAVTDFNDDSIAEVKTPYHSIINLSGSIIEVFKAGKRINVPDSYGTLSFIESKKDGTYHASWRDYYRDYHNFFEYRLKENKIISTNKRSFGFATRFDNDIALVKSLSNSNKVYLINRQYRSLRRIPSNWNYEEDTKLLDFNIIDRLNENLIPLTKGNKTNIYNIKTGKFILSNDLKNTDIFRCSCNRIVIKDKNISKYGVLDSTGKTVIPNRYDFISDFREDICFAQDGNRMEYLNKDGHVVYQF